MVEIRLPQFGMGMSDGTITAWHKSVGEHVQEGELLCEIEAAKTTVDMECPVEGILTRIFVQVQTNVPVNTIIAEMEVRTISPPPGAPAEAEAEAEAARLREEAGVPAAAMVPPVPRASPLAKRAAQDNGIDLAAVQGSGARGRIVQSDVKRVAQIAAAPGDERQIEPRARHLARVLSVDLNALTGTGPGGRVIAEDVQASAGSAASMPAPKPEAAAKPVVEPAAPPPAADVVDVPHSMIRRTIARRLTESKQLVPHFYVKSACALDALLALRREINQGTEPKVSVNDLIVRGVALALREVPDANVSWGEKAIRRYGFVDVAVAVATPRGLMTPIVRAVESKTIRQISAEIKELAGRAREGRLKPEEYSGGSVSVSNLGMFGVEEFSAILNPPQASIFAIGAGEQRPVVRDGRLEIATMMNVTISVDHRAVDGAVAAQLLAAFKRLVETPSRILA